MTAPQLTSVLIPAHDAAMTLGSQLESLAAQTFPGAWEVVVADDGSTDGTVEVGRSFSDRLPGLRVLASPERGGPSSARNRAAAEARGDLFVFCDADDEVAEGWLEAIVDAASTADLAGGVYERRSLSEGSVRHRRNEREQRGLPRILGFLPFCSSGNLAIRSSVFRDLGGWNEDYAYCEDVELAWRAQLRGYALAFAPEALIHKRARVTLGALWDQASRYGDAHARLYRDFRSEGMVRPSLRSAVRQWIWLLSHVGDLRSEGDRGDWTWIAATRWGRLRGSLRLGVVCL